MKSLFVLLSIVINIALISCTEAGEDILDEPNDDHLTVLYLADKNATYETKALYSNLWEIQKSGFMFGHHDDLWYGRKWYDEMGRSDTKDVCGDYPAVFSVDFGSVMDDRFSYDGDKKENLIRKRVIKEAYDRGEVITACIHVNNPLTGGDSWDNSRSDVVKEILNEGAPTNIKYKVWLDRLAAFALDLKGSDGKLIPVVFRPYHEHTQTWSWWGRSCTTESEFVQLWQYTVKYLRDTKGVHNFIYAISPQMDSPKSRGDFLYRWPGNEFVDFIGMDCYHGLNPVTFAVNLMAISRLSKELKKPCGVTETGVEGLIDWNGNTVFRYWTEQILTPSLGQSVSMIVMWRNKYDPNEEGHHFYSVFKGHSTESNFNTMYNHKGTYFSKDLPNMYVMAEDVSVEGY